MHVRQDPWLAEDRPTARQPEIPLHRDRQVENVSAAAAIHFGADARTVRTARKARADPAEIPVRVANPVEPKGNAHRIVDGRDEAVPYELDRAAKADAEPAATRPAWWVERAEQEMGLGLEGIVRPLAGILNRALRRGRRRRKPQSKAKGREGHGGGTSSHRKPRLHADQQGPQAIWSAPQLVGAPPPRQVTRQPLPPTRLQVTWQSPSHSTTHEVTSSHTTVEPPPTRAPHLFVLRQE